MNDSAHHPGWRVIDIARGTVELQGDHYLFEVETAAPLPPRTGMADGERVDFTWTVDTDRNREDDYHIHAFLDERGWHIAFFPISQLARKTAVNGPHDLKVNPGTKRVAVSVPTRFLPTHFAWRANALSGNISNNWLPASYTAHGDSTIFDANDSDTSLYRTRSQTEFQKHVYVFPLEVDGLDITINGAIRDGIDESPLTWDWGDGTTATGIFPGKHAYKRPGDYTVKVIAHVKHRDAIETFTGAFNISVSDSQDHKHVSVFAPHAKSLDVSVNGHSDVSVTSLTWDWGDGNVNESWFPARHTYKRPGDYTITVTAMVKDHGTIQAFTDTVRVSVGASSLEEEGHE